MIAFKLIGEPQRKKHFVQLFDKGQTDTFKLIVMQLLGPSIEDLRRHILCTDFTYVNNMLINIWINLINQKKNEIYEIIYNLYSINRSTRNVSSLVYSLQKLKYKRVFKWIQIYCNLISTSTTIASFSSFYCDLYDSTSARWECEHKKSRWVYTFRLFKFEATQCCFLPFLC